MSPIFGMDLDRGIELGEYLGHAKVWKYTQWNMEKAQMEVYYTAILRKT